LEYIPHFNALDWYGDLYSFADDGIGRRACGASRLGIRFERHPRKRNNSCADSAQLTCRHEIRHSVPGLFAPYFWYARLADSNAVESNHGLRLERGAVHYGRCGDWLYHQSNRAFFQRCIYPGASYHLPCVYGALRLFDGTRQQGDSYIRILFLAASRRALRFAHSLGDSGCFRCGL